MHNESISVVLAVCNAQRWIRHDVELLLENLADLTGRFEVIVIDAGSTDYTVEVLEELRCRFPQLRFLQNDTAPSMDSALASGLEAASGEFVFTNMAGARIAQDDLRKLWALRGDKRVLSARSRTTARRIDEALVNKLSAWANRVAANMEGSNLPAAPQVSEPLGGLQMIRREAMVQLRSSDPSQFEVSHISHQQMLGPKLVERRRARSV